MVCGDLSKPLLGLEYSKFKSLAGIAMASFRSTQMYIYVCVCVCVCIAQFMFIHHNLKSKQESLMPFCTVAHTSIYYCHTRCAISRSVNISQLTLE